MAKKHRRIPRWLRKSLEVVASVIAVWGVKKLYRIYTPLVMEWFNVPKQTHNEREISELLGLFSPVLKLVVLFMVVILVACGAAALHGICDRISRRWMGIWNSGMCRPPYPPEEYSPYMPVAANELEASLLMLPFAAVSGGMLFIPGHTYLSWTFTSVLFEILAFISLMMLANGIWTICRCRFSRRAHCEYWRGLRIAELAQKGMSLRQMPDELFSGDEAGGRFPAPDELLFLRAFEMLDFERAREIAEGLDTDDIKDEDTRAKVMFDLLYIELIGENRSERVKKLGGIDMHNEMDRHEGLISTQRMRYVLSLLCGEGLNCSEYERRFEKCAKNWKRADEVEIERKLMAMACERAGSIAWEKGHGEEV